MSAPKSDLPSVPCRSRDTASASTPDLAPSSTPCSPARPAKVRSIGYLHAPLTLDLQASKFKPPKSFVTVRRDLPSSSTPVLPSKRLSSDPETPSPSSTIQSKRPRCHIGNEKENKFFQETPLTGVTNLIRLPTPASPQRRVVEFIDLEEDPPVPLDHPSETTLEFLEVS